MKTREKIHHYSKMIVTTVLAIACISTTTFANSMSVHASTSKDSSLSRYSMEGYATVQNVTGGGILSETDSNYYKVSNATEFLKALSTAKKSKKATVIELTNDIALGSKEIGTSLSTYSNIISDTSNRPLLHPTLLKTGVSTVNIKDMNNLTIYSKNASKITHACFNLSKVKNVIIRNIVFDEIWEWDEETSGDYDRNDWDYFTVQNCSTGIWFDHCTFYKAYDGIIDVKKASDSQTTDVTISYCEFLPASEGSFFNDMMSTLEENPTLYPYYTSLRVKYGMTAEQIRGYAYGQKKVHLVGASDTEANTKNLRLTLANNLYKNSMDRLPRMRAGYAHVYNCVMDADELYTIRESINNKSAKSKIVSNGAVSTVGAQVLLENTNIKGIINPLLSGNGNSSAGYIGAVNTSYSLNGVKKELTVTSKTNTQLILDAESFKEELPYDKYQLYDTNKLTEDVLPFVGAGAVKMTGAEWMQTVYEEKKDIPEVSPAPEVKPETSTKPEATPEASAKPEATVKPEVTPEISAKPEASATPEIKPEENTKPTVTPEVKPEESPKPSQKPDIESEQEKNFGTETEVTHSFTSSMLVSDFYKITGSLSSSKGTVSYKGTTYKTALKMESATKITLTTEKRSTLTLIANSNCNKSIVIDGKEYFFNNGELTLELSAGTHTITKGDSNVNLFFMKNTF